MSVPRKATFVHPKMTVEAAGREAAMRNMILQVSWTTFGGLRVLAVPRETTQEKKT